MLIDIRKLNDNTFEATVNAEVETRHKVTLDDDYYYKLTNEEITKEALIEKSFEFLLEREDNTMILRQFDLPIIQTYFPEYEPLMRRLV